MRYSPFIMERWQSTYEHRVRFNLSESGVHPLSVSELLGLADRGPEVLDVGLGYGQSNGSDQLRDRIAALYPGVTEASVLVTIGGAEANFAAFWHLLDPDAPTAVRPQQIEGRGPGDPWLVRVQSQISQLRTRRRNTLATSGEHLPVVCGPLGAVPTCHRVRRPGRGLVIVAL